MLIISYLYDIISERRIVEDISLNLAYRWCVEYDIDEKIPEHSIFTKARKRFGKKTIYPDIQRDTKELYKSWTEMQSQMPFQISKISYKFLFLLLINL